MNRHKKWLSAVIAAALVLSMAVPALAADTAETGSVSSSVSSSVSPASSEAETSSEPETPVESEPETEAPVESEPETPSEPEAGPESGEEAVDATIISDTTDDFSVTQTATYMFRFDVDGPQGLEPTFYTEDSTVLQIEKTTLEEENGHDVYFVTVRAVGDEGESAGVYTMLPGKEPVRQCAITVGAPYVKSDTTVDFDVHQGSTYAFRFEIVGRQGLEPNIAAGNGNVLRTEDTQHVVENGHDVYYFKIRAIGNVGEASGVYTTLPGQQAVKHCTIRVSEPVGHLQIDGKWYYLDNNGNPIKGWIEADGKRYYGMPDGHLQTGWLSFGNTYYFCTSDGSVAKGWAQVGSYRYYFDPQTGKKATNTTVDGIRLGYTGRTSTAYQAAQRVLNSVGWNLRAAFNWSAGMPYRSTTANSSPGAEWFANYGFTNHCGNCYVMASTFYYMADLLGYNARQMTGYVPLARGGMGPHSWVEIKFDNGTYVYDPDFTNETGRNGFHIYYGMSGTWRYSSYHSMTSLP